jgi:hypothetical protein
MARIGAEPLRQADDAELERALAPNSTRNLLFGASAQRAMSVLAFCLERRGAQALMKHQAKPPERFVNLQLFEGMIAAVLALRSARF